MSLSLSAGKNEHYASAFTFFWIDSIQEVQSMILSSQSRRVLGPSSFRNMTFLDSRPDPLINPAKSLPGDTGLSVKIYCDSRGRIDKAWGEFKRRMNANILEKIMVDDVIKKITDRDREKMRTLERDFDVQIQVDQIKGYVRIEGHIADIANIQKETLKVLKDIKDRARKGKI